ncbi:glycosyltransferase family 2 protein [Algivirga pacifica]
MSNPLVTVVCLCYNQAPYVTQAIDSILSQTYTPIEIIIIDDQSTDHSIEVIQRKIKKLPHIQFIISPQNQGNCKAFNQALTIAKGKYIIDLAADDIMYPERVALQVEAFEKLSEDYAIVFTDTHFINENGKRIRSTYYKRNDRGQLLERVPSGDLYKRVLQNPPVMSPPTQMYRTSVIQRIGGYDDNLSYEDYDLWIRLGRNHKFYFLDEITTAKRELSTALHKVFYFKKNNKHLWSTLKICRKAIMLNENEEENRALAKSIRYHMRLSLFTENFDIGIEFGKLLKELQLIRRRDRFWINLLHWRVPLNWAYRIVRS